MTAYFDQNAQGPNFGPGARRRVEGIRKAQSQRLRRLGRMPSTEELRSLLPADVTAAAR